MKGPRYPEARVQDPNEDGLSLLRGQYRRAGNPELRWCDSPERDGSTVIIGSTVKIRLTGDPGKCSEVATLICRAVKLAWHMMNELEPESEPESEPFRG
jgi:hypothetical protein